MACQTISNYQFERLQHWLTCDECVDGERDYAKGLGNDAVRVLDSALIGPSPQRRAVMRAKLGDMYRFANQPGGDSNAYINPRFDNFIATYQKRAAITLGDIATTDAVQALDRAIRDSAARHYRSDVVRTIRVSRSGLITRTFPGQIHPAQLAYGGIVRIIAPPGEHFSAQTRAVVRDSPFAAEIPSAVFGDTVFAYAVGEPGPHAIVVSDGMHVGPPFVGAITIVSLLDATDRSLLNCAPAAIDCAVARAPRILDAASADFDTVANTAFCRAQPTRCLVRIPRLPGGAPLGSAPLTIFLSLSAEPKLLRPDTTDLLRLEPPAALAVTAVLDWRRVTKLDLSWRRCTSPATAIGNVPVTSPRAATESTSVVIPGGECWILQIKMPSGSSEGPAFARLRLTTP